MKSYKKWSAEFRQKSLKLTNKAKKLGWVDQPKKCRRCGQEKGILHLHNENYDTTVDILELAFNRFPIELTKLEKEELDKVLEPICWRCHMMHHSTRRNAMAVALYFKEIENGKQYPPVFKHNFDILKEHGI